MKNKQTQSNAAAPDQHKLATQREANDAAARASAIAAVPKALDASTHAEILRMAAKLQKSAKTLIRPEFIFDQPELEPGELYAGVVNFGGIFQHLILLPAEARNVTWQQAKTFAAAVGGELPDIGEYDVLLQNLQSEFAGEDAYWSREWMNRHEALYLDFGADPFHDWDSVDTPYHARAVRRMFAGRERAVLVDWHVHLKIAREASGMTVKQLANHVDVTPEIIERFESGEVRTIDGPLLMDICTVVNVDVAWVLGNGDD